MSHCLQASWALMASYWRAWTNKRLHNDVMLTHSNFYGSRLPHCHTRCSRTFWRQSISRPALVPEATIQHTHDWCTDAAVIAAVASANYVFLLSQLLFVCRCSGYYGIPWTFCFNVA